MPNSTQTPTATKQATEQATFTVATNHLQPHNPNRTVIDVSDIDDKEVIVIPSIDLSDVACTLESIMSNYEALESLLHLIHTNQLKGMALPAMTEIALNNCLYIANMAGDEYLKLKNALKQSSYAVEGV